MESRTNLPLSLLLICILIAAECAADTGRAPAGKHGLVMRQRCPFSCQTEGLPRPLCRDWREGAECFVEDLSRAPIPDPNPPEASGCDSPSGRIARPHVDIYRIKKVGNVFKDHYRVRGSVEGVCIAEAGYFERGALKETIPTVKIPEFRRFEFEIEIRAGRYPEIRVYNRNGDRDLYRIDPETFLDDSGYYGRESGEGRWENRGR